MPEVVYLITFMTLAITITAAFCTSRTMMARIAPVSMMSQFFGLYALSGTSQRAGFASLIILLLAGFILMRWVRQERAPEIA